MNLNEVNPLTLAYLGDSIYEVLVRMYLISNRLTKPNVLQKESIKYVSAKNQALIIDDLLSRQILTDEELYTVSRARNAKPASKPKNTSIIEYKKATSLEALFGMLYLKKDFDRINELFKEIVGE